MELQGFAGAHGWSCPSRTGQTSAYPDRRGGPATKTLKNLPAQGLPTHGQMATHDASLCIVPPADILPPRRLLASGAIENWFACAARAARRYILAVSGPKFRTWIIAGVQKGVPFLECQKLRAGLNGSQALFTAAAPRSLFNGWWYWRHQDKAIHKKSPQSSTPSSTTKKPPCRESCTAVLIQSALSAQLTWQACHRPELHSSGSCRCWCCHCSRGAHSGP